MVGARSVPSVNCHQGVWSAVLVSTELRAQEMQTYKWQAGAGAGELPRLRVRREMNSVFLQSLLLWRYNRLQLVKVKVDLQHNGPDTVMLTLEGE